MAIQREQCRPNQASQKQIGNLSRTNGANRIVLNVHRLLGGRLCASFVSNTLANIVRQYLVSVFLIFWGAMPHRFVGFTGGGGIIGQVE